MTPTSLPLLLGLVFLAVAFYRFVIHPTLLSPLAKVPCAHWSAAVSPLWILHKRFKGTENATLHGAHSRLGPVVRVAPNELSINGIEAIRTVYQGGFDKADWYSIFNNYG